MGNISSSDKKLIRKINIEQLKNLIIFDKLFDDFLTAHTVIDKESYIISPLLTSLFYSFINNNSQLSISMSDLPNACNVYINQHNSRYSKNFDACINFESPYLTGILIGRKIINIEKLINI